MLNHQRQKQQADRDDQESTDREMPTKVHSYSFKVEQPLEQKARLAQKIEPQRDNLSEQQDLADAMIERMGQRQKTKPR